jgi:C-terminal processing protease CtpA/Prc
LISAQELQQLIDDANQSLEEAGTPSHEVSVVILHREFAGGSLGITLAGGADYETKEITVHKVLTGSIADRDGRIHRGDRVLSINGKSTKGLTHREALNLLKAPRTEAVLVVSRGRSGSNGFETIEETSATLDRAVEPLLNGSLASLLENDEDTAYRWGPIKTVILVKDGAGLGFSLEGGKGSISGDMPLTVKKIFVGGPAEKSGDLKVGDLITSINKVNMSTKSRTEAWNFMKKLGDGDVRIAVRSPML